MTEIKPITNKVASSGLITLDLEKIIPEVVWSEIDLKDFLFKGLILKEKDFRDDLKQLDWEKYRDQNVCVYCSIDAIIPAWAYMLVVAYLNPIAGQIYFGNQSSAKASFYQDQLKSSINLADYKDQRVIIKGCGKRNISAAAYLTISQMLIPVVKSLMYGEACSNVPVFKRKRT